MSTPLITDEETPKTSESARNIIITSTKLPSAIRVKEGQPHFHDETAPYPTGLSKGSSVVPTPKKMFDTL